MFFKKRLKKEIQIWLKQGLIEQNQAKSLLEFYKNEQKQNFSVVNILGYFFLGLSLLVFIGHNWEQIPPLIRAFCLIGITLLTHIFAFLKLKNNDKSNLFFLANFIYGISIMLIAQVYHLGSYTPDAVFWWALGSFFVAIFIGDKWVNLQAFILSLIWFMMHSASFYPAFFWVFLSLCAFLLYKDEQDKILFYLFLLSLLYFYPFTLSYFLYDNALKNITKSSAMVLANAEFAYLIMPLFAYFVFLFSQLYSNLYFKISEKISFLILYISSFFILLDSFISEILAIFTHRDEFYFFTILAILILPILILNYWLRKYFIFSFFILSMVFVFLMVDENLIFYIKFGLNALLFCFYSFLIYKGIAKNLYTFYIYGIVGLLVFAMIRYFSLIQDYISASLLFLFCSMLLLYAAREFKRLSKREVL